MKKAAKKNTLDLASLKIQLSDGGGFYGTVRPLAGAAIYFRTEGDSIEFSTYTRKPLAAGELVEGSTLEIRVARSWYAAQGA